MKRKLMLSVTCLIVLIGLSGSAWFFLAAKIFAARAAVMELKTKVSQNGKKIEEEKNLKRMLAGISKETALVDSVFLGQAELIRLIEGLEGIGSDSGVSLQIKSINVEKNSPSLNLSLEGSFEKLFEYLYLLENLPYLINIQNVSFRKPDEGSGAAAQSGNWQADFNILLDSYEN
ncbi:hypothetical protein C4572_03590 [Candidatus Parcubacteria bacterium]|nr:MAG: hypothetical protein C4572_03590 [Candidatus Parcubacteria bacterium]